MPQESPSHARPDAIREESTLMWERWVNEGGRPPPEDVAERERAGGRRLPRRMRRQPVIIAGAGVAAMEALLALRALGAHVDVTLVAPGPMFVDRSAASGQPFARKRVRGVRLEHVAADLDAHWHRGSVDRVEHDRRRIVTRNGEELAYSALVLAVGARAEREWDCDRVLTYHDGADASSFRLLLRRLRDGTVRRVAFVRPPGPTWPLPLYDLAFMTATDCATHGCADARLTLVTPESEPLGVFGAGASAEVRRLLQRHGVALYTASYGQPGPGDTLEIVPGDRRLPVDRIVTLPRLKGPRLRGVPCGRDGFIHTDAFGRVAGLDGVFAAGDATSFPVKQGGLAAQQADAVADVIAAATGADVEPRPFRPMLRAALLTGGRARFLRADISGADGDDSAVSCRPLWAPATKLYGRHLAAYLGREVGDVEDVLRPYRHSTHAPVVQA